MCAGRLAQWCQEANADHAPVRHWLEVAVAGFSSLPAPPGEDPPAWTAPAQVLDAVDPNVHEPWARATLLVDAAHRWSPNPALLAVGDLVEHFLAGLDAPSTSGRTAIPILVSRHSEGELDYLVVIEREGPPGIALDSLVGPFTRPDPTFVMALETAWHATQSPSLSARWSVISERTGMALEVIQGRSVGAGAALALRYLSHAGLPPMDPTWAITGAVDADGAFGTLLAADHDLATYRNKLIAAGARTVVVPRCDHHHIAGLVEAGGLTARLMPAASVGDVIDAAGRDLAGRRAYNEAVESRVVTGPVPAVSAGPGGSVRPTGDVHVRSTRRRLRMGLATTVIFLFLGASLISYRRAGSDDPGTATGSSVTTPSPAEPVTTTAVTATTATTPTTASRITVPPVIPIPPNTATTTEPTSVPTSTPSTSPPPLPGNWAAQPPQAGIVCENTRTVGNLHWQVCLAGNRAVLQVTVSGTATSGTSHSVAVPRISTVGIGTSSRGMSCPPRLLNIADRVACFDQSMPQTPGSSIQGYGRLDHDGVEGPFTFSPMVTV
ncbi:MAG: hypothetical protein ACR2KK_09125 [Acidimicrobiales bacterium]